MKTLIFFMLSPDNKCHYGDLFTCKGYIKQIQEKLKDQIEIRYWHLCSQKAIEDLNLKSCEISLTQDELTLPYIEKENTLYINIWRFQRIEFNSKIGVNHEFLQRSWNNIFKKINDFFKVNLIIHNSEYYIPSIDYSLYDKNTILNNYIKNSIKTKKILISNGIVTSGQSFVDNMAEIIIPIANSYKNIDFICTSPFSTNLQNIKFTDNIIGQNSIDKIKCDINEISYLSTFCDIIIGKNSGPFIYCLTPNNLLDKNKLIISFHKRKTDDMFLNLQFNCKYQFYKMSQKTYDPKVIYEVLNTEIKNYYD